MNCFLVAGPLHVRQWIVSSAAKRNLRVDVAVAVVVGVQTVRGAAARTGDAEECGGASGGVCGAVLVHVRRLVASSL